MGQGMFDGVGEAFMMLLIIACISLPLALWKVIEIVVWFFKHVSITIGV